MSSFTPVVTFSSTPTLPFFPFVVLAPPPLLPLVFCSSAIRILNFSSAGVLPAVAKISGPRRGQECPRHTYTPVKNAPGSLKCVGCPFGHEYNFDVSTRICPSGASSIFARSIGRGAGPSKLIPSLSYPLPWQGHLNLFSLGFQSGVHPKCVQRAQITNSRSGVRSTQIRYFCCHFVSTPNA